MGCVNLPQQSSNFLDIFFHDLFSNLDKNHEEIFATNIDQRMSGVELRPCGLSSGNNILVPLGNTTIGRGPFLSIADKRVSRNHAILEIENGVFRVKPIHVNPTFFAEKGEVKLKPLKRDEWQELDSGDRVSLTPNEHIFEVLIDDRPVQASLTQSPRSSPVKALPKDSPAIPAILQISPAAGEDIEKAPSPACRKLEYNPGEDKESTAEEETNGGIEEKETGDKQGDDEGKTERDKDTMEEDAKVDTKEYAKPVDRKRELPAWMATLSSSDTPGAPTEALPKPKATPKATGRAKKRKDDDIDFDGEDLDSKPPAKKPAPPTPRGRKKAVPPPSLRDDDDAFGGEDEDDDDSLPELKKRTSARGRTTSQVSYADGDDDDFIPSGQDSGDDEDGSDWESENTPRKKGRKQKGSSASQTKGRKGRKGGRRRSYSDESSEDDVYIPKLTKRTAKILSSSQRSSEEEEPPTPRGKGRGAKKRKVEEEEKDQAGQSSEDEPLTPRGKGRGPRKWKVDDEEKDQAGQSSEDEPLIPKGKGRGARKRKGDEEPEQAKELSEDESPAPRRAKKEKVEEESEGEEDQARGSCEYGAKCYRKNRAHRKEFSHPGDDDYVEKKDDDEEEVDEDDKPECPYGAECYRKNVDHRKQFKHSVTSDRPKRQTRGRRKANDDGDENGSNTYDYDDSFLDEDEEDESDEQSPKKKKKSDDSDFDPEESEDLSQLVRESKGFVKNKKMQKKV